MAGAPDDTAEEGTDTVSEVREAATVAGRPHRSVHDAATAAVVRPAVATDAPPVREAGSTARTSQAPFEYLRADEIERTHRFALLGVAIFIGALATLPLVSGGGALKLALAISLGVSFVTNLWVIYLTADPARYTDLKIAAGWIVHAITIGFGLAFYGVFSALPVITVLTVYFSSLAYSARLATGYYAICAGTQATLAALVISKTIEDPGVLHADYLPLSHQIVGQLLVQLVLAIAYVLARLSRRTTVRKIAEMEATVRAVAQREALLQEARMDLERALRIGDSGRFSGQTLGSFQLGVVIGRGGMGEVYRATHVTTQEAAAVKLLRHDAVDDGSAVRRFMRELRVASTIRAANVVRVLEIADDTSPLPYLAMELLSGQDLSHHLRALRTFDVAQTIKLLTEVGAGIAAAHATGVVHRDLKPQNLFLAEQPGGPIWKILDFGVSKLGDHGGTLTEGKIVGTPAYMAPEQAQGREVDHRVDVYALSAVAYRVLTGQPPFQNRDVPAMLHDVVYAMPRRPCSLATLPADIEDVLAIGLAKDPAARFGSAEELVAAFVAAFEDRLPAKTRDRARTLLAQRPWA